MFLFQSVDSLQYLKNLIGFCSTALVLNIHPGISLPRRFVHAVAGALLACVPKVLITYFAQIRKAHAARVTPHPGDNISNPCHARDSITIDTTVNKVRHRGQYQYGPWEGQALTIDEDWLIKTLLEKVAAINWTEAAEDVARFLNAAEQQSLKL